MSDQPPKWLPPVLLSVVLAIPVVIVIGNFFKLSRWDDYCGTKYDFSRLSEAETSSASKIACYVAETHNEYQAKHEDLRGLEYRVALWPTDKPVLEGIAATAVLERDWWWSAPYWEVRAVHFNTKRTEHWWQYQAHEVFAHLAYIHTDRGRNHDHKETHFLATEVALKQTMTASISR